MFDFDALEATCAELEVPTPPGWLSRHDFQRVANFRDCAVPLPGGDERWRYAGGRMRRGRLYRTAQWGCATAADVRRLRDGLGLVTYLDLRSGKEYEGADAPIYDVYPPSPSGPHGLRLPPAGESRRLHCNFAKDLSVRSLTAAERAGSVTGRRQQCAAWYQQQLRDPKVQGDVAARLGALTPASYRCRAPPAPGSLLYDL